MKAMKSLWLACAASAALEAGMASGAESAAFRVDARKSLGGRLGTATEWVGETDGGGGRLWNTAEGADGWVSLESQGSSARVFVLNGPAVEGGRLEGAVSWGADRVHVVRDDVVVGAGASLALERSAVVKFTPGAKIVVEEGGDLFAKGAYLADIADDRVGGDTNLDGGATQPGGAEWWLEDETVGNLLFVEWIGGGDLPKTAYDRGATYGELPVPEERGDAIFGGWFTKSGGGGSLILPELAVNDRALALYAHWVPLSLSVEPGSVAAPPAGGVCEVAVSANAPWTAEPAADWIDAGGGAGDGDGTLSLRMAPHEGAASRVATVRVALSKGGAFRDVAVSQDPMERVATPVPLPADGTAFGGASQRVEISCATAGAEIRYTLDGSEPGAASLLYAGPFDVFESCTVKARAFKDGLLASGTASARLVRLLSLADAIDQPLWTVETGAERPWLISTDTTHDGVHSARSGFVGVQESSVMETEVGGAGWVRFWWKTACESGAARLSFRVDGRRIAGIDGDSGWRELAVRLDGAPAHRLSWEYAKEWFDETPTADAGWVDQVSWAPIVDGGEVPESWLADLGLLGPGMSGAEAAAADVDGDGYTAAQEYLAGTDPTDPDSFLFAGIDVRGGLAEVSWSPDLEHARDYRILAKRAMLDPEWTDVTDLDDRSEYRFFMVEVRAVE